MAKRKCILSEKICDKCGDHCPHYVALHGKSGNGGRVGASGIPEEYRFFTVENNPVREGQPEAYKVVDKIAESYARMFDEPESPADRIKNVYLWSRSPGTGKTATASALANRWQARHYVGRIKSGKVPEELPVYFLDMAEFHQIYTEFTRPGIPDDVKERASRMYYRMMNRAKQAPLVIMDDIGEGEASEGFRRDVHAIVHGRYKRGAPTVYTSNAPITELTDIFDAKLYDRVRDLTVSVHFKGDSKRGKRK